MRRRTLIATIGSALFAGCGSLDQATTGPAEAVEERKRIPSGVEPVEDIGIQGDLGVDGGVDVQPVDDIGIDQDIEIAEDIGVRGDLGYGRAEQLQGEGLDEGGDPIEVNERAAGLIERARSQLRTAITTYASQAGSRAVLTDVNAATTGFSALPVTREVNAARDILDRASGPATMGQQTIIMALGQCASFLEHAAQVDEALTEAYEEYEFMRGRVLSEQQSQARMARQRLQSKVNDAESAYEALERVTSMQMMAAMEEISAEMYRTKIRQLGNGIRTLEDFGDALERLQSAIQETDVAAGKYGNDQYRAAANRLVTATSNAGMATTLLRNTDDVTGLREEAIDTSLIARTLEQTLHDLERHARAKADENRILATEALEAAEQHHDSNDAVSGLSAWTGFPFS